MPDILVTINEIKARQVADRKVSIQLLTCVVNNHFGFALTNITTKSKWDWVEQILNDFDDIAEYRRNKTTCYIYFKDAKRAY